MDWTGIIIAILTGGTITGAIEAIRYRRENKRLKEAETAKAENEVKDNETDTQMKQMDMADKYFDGMLKMLEQVKNSTESGNVNQKKMMDDLSDIRKRMGVLEESTSNIVAYLNGDYQNWLNNQIRNGRATEEQE
jgi:cysteine synthase